MNHTEEEQRKIIVASLSPYFKKRFAQFNIDLYSKKQCESCNQKIPNILFSLSNTGKLNKYCKFCWKTVNDKEKLDKSLTGNSFKRELNKYFYKKQNQ